MKRIYIAVLAACAFVISAVSVFAQTTFPTATSTMNTLLGTIITTTVDVATSVFATVWPYALIVIVIAGVIALMYRLAHMSAGKGK